MATWSKTLQFVKDPYDVENYIFKWGSWLNGANISAATVEGTNITIDSYSIVNGLQDVLCTVSGGDTTAEGIVSCKVTTDGATPRRAERSVTFIHEEL